MAESTDPVSGPLDRDKAVSAGYLRILGESQERAATAAGVGERTLARWETCSWWPEILREAESRWLQGLVSKARHGLERGVQEDGRLALSVLERRIPELAPPRQGVDLRTPDGITVEELTADEMAKRKARLTNRIAELTGGKNGKRNGAR